MKCCGPTLSLATILTSLFVCCIGILLKFILPGVIDDAITKNMVLTETSVNYENWVVPPIALYTKYFLFNYTNAEEFVNTWKEKGTKPRVQQLGPYVYRISRRKINITFLENGEVEYYTTRTVTFVPEMSNGTEDDKVTFPNIVLRSTVNNQRTRDQPWETSALFFLPGVTPYPFRTEKVGDFLFDGYYDPIIEAILMNAPEGTAPFTDDKFRFMKRSVESGPVVVKTGSGDISQFGQVVSFNNQSIMSTWPDDSPCNVIRGSDGSMFPPKLPTDKRLYVFAGDLCRSLFFRFERKVEHFGVPANRFVLDPDTFANTNPENECFCKSTMNKCWGSGVYNVGKCRNDTQIIISLPHFYNTDYRIKNAIDGLAPDPEKHNFYLDIEPTTGVPISASSNMQINLGIERTPWLAQADNLPEIILPILWMSDGASLNESMAAMIKAKVIDGPQLICDTIPLAILILGAVLGLLGMLCSIFYMFKANKTTVQPFKEKTTIHAFSY